MNDNRHDDEIADGANVAMTVREFEGVMREASRQPPWRTNADREADYADGNQLSTELLQRQAELASRLPKRTSSARLSRRCAAMRPRPARTGV